MINNHTVEGYINEAIKMIQEHVRNVALHNGIISLLTEAKQLYEIQKNDTKGNQSMEKLEHEIQGNQKNNDHKQNH